MNRARALRLGPLGALLVLLLALLVGALSGSLVVVALAGLGLAVCEVVLHRLLPPAQLGRLDLALGAVPARLWGEQALLLVFVVGTRHLSRTEHVVVVVAVVAYQLVRVAHDASRDVVRRLEVPRAQARGLADWRPTRPSLSPLLGPRGSQALLAASGLPALGLLWAAVTGSYALVAPAAIVMVLVGAAVVAACVPGVLALRRRPRGEAQLAAVHAAVVRHRPEVVLYSDGNRRDLHWVTGWSGTLDELEARGRRALIMVRDPEVFDVLPPTTTPVVCLPGGRDVRPFTLPDARVALYVANAPSNVLLLRNPRLRSAFVFHGDSDKAASANPVVKMYDEVWVAGEAGRDRYLQADIGVRAEGVRLIGRPQVQGLHRGIREPGGPFSVLYAPTWEGLYDDPTESSLLHSGPQVVRRLLALDGVRVLYRPHPKTGAYDPRLLRADAQVRAALAQAGTPHAVVESPTTGLFPALDMTDVLVTDVSAMISDFLASGRPYAVVNGTDLDDDAFRRRFPSTAGALLVGEAGAGLEAAVADARGPDTLRAARERVRVQLIGPPTDDPVGLFAAAIDALGSTLGSGRNSDTVAVAGRGGAD